MATLEILEKQHEEYRAKCFEIRDQIDEIKTKEILPQLKEQYEGKYWRYRNRTSSEESWWLYSFCVEAVDERSGKFHQFETTPYQSEFKVSEDGHYHLCEEEITKDEYLKALDEFITEVSGMANCG